MQLPIKIKLVQFHLFLRPFMFCPAELKLVCKFKMHTYKCRQAHTCADTWWMWSRKPSEAGNQGNRKGQYEQRKDYKEICLIFAICQAKGKSCVISLAHCYFTMLLCTTLCVCPGQEWTLNTMTSPTLIRTVIVPHLTKAYVDFLFPMKLFSEQHVPQCVPRFLDFVFCSILLMSLSWFWF